jgi:uncharacterized protein YcbK (DUF882 family)
MKITKNFYLSEFQSKDGAAMPKHVLKNVLELSKNLQTIRDYIGVPIHINSAYRSPDHNKRVGGVKNSKHLQGIAADITAKDYTPRKLSRVIRKLIKEGKIKQGGIGLYNGFVHYDIRNYRARWDYSSLFNW